MKAWLNGAGKLYKAEKAESDADMERVCASVEGLAVLPETSAEAIDQLEWDIRVHKEVNKEKPDGSPELTLQSE